MPWIALLFTQPMKTIRICNCWKTFYSDSIRLVEILFKQSTEKSIAIRKNGKRRMRIGMEKWITSFVVTCSLENMFDNIWHLICLHLISGFILCFILWIDFSNRTKELQMRNCVKAETYNKLFENIDRVSGKLFTFISHTDQHRHETPIQF